MVFVCLFGVVFLCFLLLLILFCFVPSLVIYMDVISKAFKMSGYLNEIFRSLPLCSCCIISKNI